MPKIFTVLTLAFFALLLSTHALLAVGKTQKGIHPVVDSFSGTGLLMGGSSNGAWVYDENIKNKLTGKEQYRLYTATKYLGTAIGGKPEDVEESSYEINLDGSKALQKEQMVIGVCGAWNALPRVPKAQDTKQPVYVKAVKDLLARKGLPDTKVNITRLWRVDLDGDGREEVLINAITSRKDFGDDFVFRRGDYSLVLLRKVINKRVVTIPVVLNYFIEDSPEDYSVCPERYSLEAVLDVNGDGVMEIITGYHAALWSGKKVFSVTGDKVKERFSSYSGA